MVLHLWYLLKKTSIFSTLACCRRTTPVYRGRRTTGKHKDITRHVTRDTISDKCLEKKVQTTICVINYDFYNAGHIPK